MLIVVVGSTQVVHLISNYATNLKFFNYDKDEAINYTYSMLALPCALTSLTTAFGMVSFLLSRSVAVKEFGGCASVAMLICGIVGLFFVLFFMAFIPVRNSDEGKNRKVLYSAEGIRYRIAKLSSNRTLNLILVCVIVGAFSIKASDVKRDMYITNNFRDGHVFAEHVNNIHKDFGGIGRMKLVIQSPEPGVFLKK